MATADFSRAIVYLSTNGLEGKSPYVLADVINELKERRDHVQLVEVHFDPLRFVLDVDHHKVYIWAGALAEQTDEEMIFYVQCGNRGIVRVDVIKCLREVPVGVIDDPAVIERLLPLETSWYIYWPTFTNSWLKFKHDHLNAVDSNQFRCMRYMSELIFVDAIETALCSLAW